MEIKIHYLNLVGNLEQGIMAPLPVPSTSPSLPEIPPSLTPQQHLELQHLQEFRDTFSQLLTDIGRTHLITHCMHTHGLLI